MEQSDVFISYRRKDVDFTKEIEAALRATGREVWVDWEDIPPGVEGFAQEIQRGIEGADAFIAILSPSYLESEYCLMELREALKLKKRVIPIVLQKFEPLPPPEGIGHINWVYFTPHAGQDNTFKQSFPKVIQALEADNEHTRAHTRFLLRAIDWEKNTKNPSYLLKGTEIDVAEKWQAAAVSKNPPATELQTQYILASRQQQRKQQQQIMSVVGALLVIAAIAAVLAVFQALEANRQADIAQAAEATAEAQAEIALTARRDAEDQAIIAQNERMLAETQEAIALTARADSETQEAIALTARSDAQAQEALALEAQAESERQAALALQAEAEALNQAEIAQSRALSASALASNNPNAVALALEATHIENPPLSVISNLYDIAYQPGIRRSFSFNGNNAFFKYPTISGDEQSFLIQNRLFDMNTGEIIRSFENAPELVLGTAFTPDGSQVILVGDSYIDSESPTTYFGFWDVATGALVREFDVNIGVSRVQISADGKTIASFEANDMIHLWNIETGQVLEEFQASFATFNADFSLLAYVASIEAVGDTSLIYTIEILDLATGQIRMSLDINNAASKIQLQFDTESTELAVITDNFFETYSLAGDLINSYHGHSGFIDTLDYSANSIISAGEDRQIIIWERGTGKVLQTLSGHNATIIFTQFLNNATQALSLDMAGQWFVWDLQEGDLLPNANPSCENNCDSRPSFYPEDADLLYNSDQSRAAYLTEEGRVLVLIDMRESREIQRFQLEADTIVWGLRFSNDNQNLILASYWGPDYQMQLRQLNLATGLESLVYAGYFSYYRLSPDGKFLIVTNVDEPALLVGIDLASKAELFRITSRAENLWFVDDGQHFIVSEYLDATISVVALNLRDSQTGLLIRNIIPSTLPNDGLLLTPDNRSLIISADRAFQGVTETSSGIAVGYLVNIRYVQLWDYATGTLLRDYPAYAFELRLSPDNNSFMAYDYHDNLQSTWRLDSLPELITWVCENRYIAEFSPEERERFSIRNTSNLCNQ